MRETIALHCSLLFAAGLQFEFINPIFEFSKGMNELQLNDAEYALLIAINIFSAGKKARRSEELQQWVRGQRN